MSLRSNEEEDVVTPENTSPLSGGWVEERSQQGKRLHQVKLICYMYIYRRRGIFRGNLIFAGSTQSRKIASMKISAQQIIKAKEELNYIALIENTV